MDPKHRDFTVLFLFHSVTHITHPIHPHLKETRSLELQFLSKLVVNSSLEKNDVIHVYSLVDSSKTEFTINVKKIENNRFLSKT